MSQTTCAAFTMARNEPLHLRVWLSYYTKELGPEACYAIVGHNDPTVDDAKAAFPKANYVYVQPLKPGQQMTGYYDDPVERWRLRIVRQWQEELLRHYACVIWGDTDELLLPEEGIIKYCEDVFIPSGKDRIRSECWSPVQQPDEPSVRKESGVSILENRSKMWRLHMYDKTLLVRTPQVYSKGMHLTYGLDGQGRRCDNGLRQRYHGEPIDPTLPMVHTWRVDMDDWYADGKWRYGVTPEECREYFRTNKCSKIVNDNGPHVDGDPHPIPQSWKDKLVWH